MVMKICFYSPILYFALMFFLAGCGRISFEEIKGDADTATLTSTPTSGGDADTDTGMGTDTVKDSATDTGMETDTVKDSATDTGMETDTVEDSATDTGMGTDTAKDSATDTGMETDTGTGSAIDTGMGLDTGTESATDSGTGAVTDTDTVGDIHVDDSLNLAEAIDLANSTPGSQTITIEPGWTEVISTTLPTLTDTDGVIIVGNGAVIDGTNLNGQSPCMEIVSGNVTISDMEISNCKGEPIIMQDGGSNVGYNQIHDCVFRNNGKPLLSNSGVVGNIIGPGNLVENSVDRGIESHCDGDRIIGNEVFNSGTDGIMVSVAANGQIIGNLVVGGVQGIAVLNNTTGWVVWHNTLVSAQSVAFVSGVGSSSDVRNNIFAYSDGWGVSALSIPSTLDYNLYFSNTTGDCSGCSIGLNAVTGDPVFVDMANDNYLLDSGSNAIDAGVDLGWDVNGVTAGNYNGAAPDIGYDETP